MGDYSSLVTSNVSADESDVWNSSYIRDKKETMAAGRGEADDLSERDGIRSRKPLESIKGMGCTHTRARETLSRICGRPKDGVEQKRSTTSACKTVSPRKRRTIGVCVCVRVMCVSAEGNPREEWYSVDS